jgi:hypothetical protein
MIWGLCEDWAWYNSENAHKCFMAQYSNGYEERLRREIRDVMAIDPIATLPELTEKLSKRLNHSFDRRYIKKLRDKVGRQLIVESDRTKIEDRMRFTKENYRIARDELMKIIISRAPSRDRVEAAKALVMLDLAVFKAEIETGMFKQPMEEVAKVIQYEPLEPEVRAVVIESWTRMRLLPAATIEEMVPSKTAV